MGVDDPRFWSKVDKTSDPNGCWLWTAGRDKDGYGRYQEQSRVGERAHRSSYRRTYGPIHPLTPFIDHMCHNPPCVNPEHLRAVTPKQNAENRKGANVGSASKFQGVSWHKKLCRWRVDVRHNGKLHYFGTFEDEKEANIIAVAARENLHTHTSNHPSGGSNE